MGRLGRYRFAELRRAWNREAKSRYKIPVWDKEAYSALKEEAVERMCCSGQRHLEMPSYQAKDGCTHVFEF